MCDLRVHCSPGSQSPSQKQIGAADEDYTPTPTSCDVAGCIRAGLLVCTAGALSDTCSAAQPCVAESACNDDLDNDGDLLVDCDDPDCSAETICDVQTFTITVTGMSSLWGAGLASPPGGGNLPPGVTLELTAGAIVRFTSVTGMVAQNGPALAPDGTPGTDNIPNSGAVAGFTHGTFGRTLAAVFLDGGPPAGPPPARLAFANQDFSSLSPLVRQLFAIGDGLTSGAVRQQFVVPAGATRLFVGITDRCAGNVPGCFGDNSGSFTVTGEIRYE